MTIHQHDSELMTSRSLSVGLCWELPEQPHINALASKTGSTNNIHWVLTEVLITGGIQTKYPSLPFESKAHTYIQMDSQKKHLNLPYNSGVLGSSSQCLQLSLVSRGQSNPIFSKSAPFLSFFFLFAQYIQVQNKARLPSTTFLILSDIIRVFQ